MSNKVKALSKKLSKYEWGRMDDKEFFSFFQELIDSGTISQLQGHYGRVAQNLIEEGICCEN